MVFHWSLSDSKFPQIYRTFLSILVDLNNAQVRMVSTHPLIFKSSKVSTHPILISLFTPWEFFTTVLADGLSLEFEWQESHQVPRTFLSILAFLNNVVVWTAKSTILQGLFFCCLL